MGTHDMKLDEKIIQLNEKKSEIEKITYTNKQTQLKVAHWQVQTMTSNPALLLLFGPLKT